MTTHEIHQCLDRRAGKHIESRIVKDLLDLFKQPVNETNLEAFLKYAWE